VKDASGARRVRAALTATACAAAALAAAPTTVGAAVPPTRPGDATDPHVLDGTAQRELDAAKQRWHEAGVRAYRMRVALGCFCPRTVTRPRTLTVRRGRPDPRTPSHLRRWATVGRQFARIQEAIDAGAARLTVRYAGTGRPASISIDYRFTIADEEMSVAVDRFSPVR